MVFSVFDGWFKRKTTVMQAFSSPIPTGFTIFSIGGEADGSVVIVENRTEIARSL